MSALILASILAVAAPLPAAAQEVHAFNVSTSDPASAIRSFGLQAGIQILASADDLRGKTLNPVSGKISTEQALNHLLAGTGLDHRYVGDRAVALVRNSPESGDSAHSLHYNDTTAMVPQQDPSKPVLFAQAEEKPKTKVSDKDQQTVKSAEKPAQKIAQLEEVIVTGSRIPQAAKESAQDVQVYTRETIEQSGQTNVSNFLNTLSSVSVSSTERGALPFGNTSVQLRGLPLGTTLTLLNGRRLETIGALSSFDVFDLNNIPLAAVDRIEVLADGSSAIYGSDAIAGVVNILLKKNYDGFEASTKFGGVYGANESNSTFAWGKKWTRGSFSILGSYQTRSELNADDRAITASQDFRRFGGPNNNLHACNPGNIYSVDGVTPLPGLGSATFAAVPAGFTGTPSVAEFAGTAGTLNECGFIVGESLIPKTRRRGVLLQANYELGASTELFAELLYSRVEEFLQLGLFSLYGEPSFVFLTAGPANPYNPFKTTVGISGVLTAVDQGQYLDTNFFRPVIGVKGSFSDAWHWELSALQSSDWSEQFSPFNDTSSTTITATFTAIQNALNSSNPATALNPFVPGGLGPPALVQSFFASFFGKYAGRVRSFNGELRGPLFSLPAGPVELVVGGVYGRDNLSARSIDPVESSQYFSRRTSSAFAEARVPILSGHDRPQSGDVLAVALAGRYDNYSDFGKTTNPQFGVAWRPLESLLIRGTYATAFKAPPLFDLYQPQTTTLEFLPDPALNGQQENMQVVGGGNPKLQPETGRSQTFGFVYDSRAVPSLQLAVTWWKVHEGKAIGFISSTAILANESLFPGLVIRNPGSNGQPGTVNTVFDAITNFGDIDVTGFDYRLNYQYRSAFGAWTPSLSATRTTHYAGALQPGVPAVDGASMAQLSGNWAPRWKGSAALGWKLGPYTANVDGRYVGSYTDYVGPRKIGNFWFCDANFRYALGQAFAGNKRWLQGTYMELGGVNLLNKQAQYSDYSPFLGYDPTQADLRGRFLYGQLGVKF